MRKTIIYQMLPRLWGNGKFSGIDDASLDYFKKLSISHLWFTGTIRHSSGKDFVKGDPGSPYSIADYYDVNPYLAECESDRMNEFCDLVDRTHRHGMKVILDFIPNHVGRDYSDAVGGIPHHLYSDYDWTDTYKIDYSHPETWNKMKEILLYWAGKGVDGFRCDMVELVPPEFLRWVIAESRKEYPDLFFVAEVYNKDGYRQFVEEVGFDLLYDKSGLYDVLRSIAAGHGSARAITWNWQFLQDLQPKMLNFLENHDEQRIASPWFTGQEHNTAYLYASLAFNTSAFMLYFGQEIGTTASEGHEGRTSIFNWCHPEELKMLDDYIHGNKRLSREKAAVLKEYREALAFATKDAISSGLVYDLCYCQKTENGFNFDKDFVFLRHSADKTKKLKHKTFLLYLSFGDNGTEFGTKNTENKRRKVKVIIPQDALSYLGLEDSINLQNGSIDLEIEANGYSILAL